jgi:flavin-dependent dehydrogenase
MRSWDYDMAVVGGGPGGSTAAIFARMRGMTVLLAEKERFPRFHIGESLLPMGNSILRELGVWDRVEAAGFIRKYGAAFFTSGGRTSTEIEFGESLVPGLDYTYQIERARFDSLLLERAREVGVDVRCETTVRALESGGTVHRVRLEAGSEVRSVTARWVLDAGGRDNLFALPQKDAVDPMPFPRRVAIYSHFRGVAREPGRRGGHTIAVRLEDGWFWLIPIDGERTSVGLVTTAGSVRAGGARPEAVFARAVAGSAKLRELLAGAEPTMPYRVTSDYSYFRRRLAGERLLLVGDAAGFFDPIFSSGVYMSMWSARLAVGLAANAHASARGLSAGERRRYTREIKRHAGVFRRLISVFYDNGSFAVFMCRRVPWNIRPALCAIVAGHARLTWPLWWRFRAFLAVCWLQRRRVPLCPALDYDGGGAEPAVS